MATLTGQKIKDTYDGLLKTNDSTSGLPVTGKTNIEDGVGNDSALSLGRDGQGATITGKTTTDIIGDVYASDSNRVLNNGGSGGLTATFRGDVLAQNGDKVLENGTSQSDATFKGDVIAEDGSTIIASGSLGGNGTFGSVLTDQIEAKTQPQGSTTNGSIEVSSAILASESLSVEGPIDTQSNISCNGGSISVTQGDIEVSGQTNFIKISGSNGKLGIRTNPTKAFDCAGNADISGLVNFGSGRFQHVGWSNGTRFGNYGKTFSNTGAGNLPSMAMKNGDSAYAWGPRYNLAIGPGGIMVEDEKYYTIEITPSGWGANTGGNGYDEYNLFNFTVGPVQMVEILGVEYLRKAQMIPGESGYPPVRGGYGGPNSDPYIFIRTGQQENAQIWSMSLGEYRNNDGMYITNKPINPIAEDGTGNNETFRAGFMPRLGLRRLNRPDASSGVNETRPNYNVYLRIKFRLITGKFMVSTTERTIS